MPFDGTDLTILENPTLLKLGQVERLLATEQQWCKGSLQDSDGRRCLMGAMKAAEARQMLEAIMLRAAREVGGKRYWRVEFFNDDPRTTHADVLRVLRRARENVIAEMAGHSHRQLWRQRFSRMFRALCSVLCGRGVRGIALWNRSRAGRATAPPPGRCLTLYETGGRRHPGTL